jgi:hypothetical protein
MGFRAIDHGASVLDQAIVYSSYDDTDRKNGKIPAVAAWSEKQKRQQTACITAPGGHNYYLYRAWINRVKVALFMNVWRIESSQCVVGR